MRHVLLRIHGQVQGVGYRWGMVREAQRLGVAGWVRNRRDGTVEAYVQADGESLDCLLNWARRGPAGALVTDVDIVDTQPQAVSGFEQRDTV